MIVNSQEDQNMYDIACLNSASLDKAYYIANDRKSPLRLPISVALMMHEEMEDNESKIFNLLEIGFILGSNLN